MSAPAGGLAPQRSAFFPKSTTLKAVLEPWEGEEGLSEGELAGFNGKPLPVRIIDT